MACRSYRKVGLVAVSGDRAIIKRELASLLGSDTAAPSSAGSTGAVLPPSTVSGALVRVAPTNASKVGASPPPPPLSGERVKISARFGAGGDWIHVKVDADEIKLVQVKAHLATSMQVSPLAFNYMQYQDAQGDWFAVLQDDDLVDAVAEQGGKKLVLQALTLSK